MKPFFDNGFKKPMQQEFCSCTSHMQPSTTPKRPNYNPDFTKPPPELWQNSMNTPSLESILKGKVIKEFVPQVQKEQKVSKSLKLLNEPAKSKPSAPTPMPKPPMLT